MANWPASSPVLCRPSGWSSTCQCRTCTTVAVRRQRCCPSPQFSPAWIPALCSRALKGGTNQIFCQEVVLNKFIILLRWLLLRFSTNIISRFIHSYLVSTPPPLYLYFNNISHPSLIRLLFYQADYSQDFPALSCQDFFTLIILQLPPTLISYQTHYNVKIAFY